MKRRDRRALILGAAVLGPIAVGYLGIRPYAQSVARLRAEIVREAELLALEATVANSEADAGLPAELAVSLDAHAERMFLVSGLRTSDESVDPLAYARLLGVASGLDIQSAEAEVGEGPTPEIVAVRLLVVALTDVTGLQRYLGSMAAGPKSLRLAELSVSPVGEAREDGVEPLSVRMIFEAYAAADEPGSGPTGELS